MGMTKAEESRAVTENRDVVEKCARKYVAYGVLEEDLVQEGMIGLVSALRTFDPSRGMALRSWINFHVRAQIRGVLGLNNNETHTTRQRDRREVSKQSNYRPIGFSLDRNVEADGDETTMHEVLAAPGPSPEDIVAGREASAALRVLRPDELAVITARFANDATLAEAGETRGVTRERARQIEAKGLARMAKVLRA